MTAHTYRARSIVERCDSGDALIVVAGSIGIELSSDTGCRIAIADVAAGHWLLACSFPSEDIVRVALRAGSKPTQIGTVGRESLERAIRESCALRFHVLTDSAALRRSLVAKIRDFSFFGVRSRVATRLLEIDDAGDVPSLQDLAIAAASKPGVIWNTLYRFRREGLIEINARRLKVVNREKLRTISALARHERPCL